MRAAVAARYNRYARQNANPELRIRGRQQGAGAGFMQRVSGR